MRGFDEYRYSHLQKSQASALGGGVDFNASTKFAVFMWEGCCFYIIVFNECLA